MEYLLAVLLFAISSSVTPGPNNVLVMTSGVNFGVRKSLPLLCGICIGFGFMLFAVGIGFMQLFSMFPSLHMVIKVMGVSYLLYLAWLIAKSSSEVNAKVQAQPLTFINGALFQWVNGKAWIVASGAVAAFSTVGASNFEQSITIALIFLMVSFPCVGIWLLFGSLLKQYLSKPTYRKLFNYTMATLLVASVLPVVLEILHQVK